MASLDVTEELHSYLRGERDTLVGKLDGLSERRRPAHQRGCPSITGSPASPFGCLAWSV